MLDNDILDKRSGSIRRGLFIGGIVGGIIGIVIGFLYSFQILIIQITIPFITFLPLSPIITGTVFGIVMGTISGALITLFISLDSGHEAPSRNDNSTDNKCIDQDSNNSATLKFHEEQLDISKRKIQTGNVNIFKEIIIEDKNISVPVKREELVIKKTVYDTGSNNQEGQTETIRIPVREEKIDITKHAVPLQEVSINKHRFEEKEHITETLKKEVPHIKTTGGVIISEKKNE